MNQQAHNLNSRKGAASPSLVPSDVLKHLESGQIQTVNLSEWLAIDQLKLLNTVLKSMGLAYHFPEANTIVHQLKQRTAPKVIDAIAAWLSRKAATGFAEQAWNEMSTHTSDMVRCWAVAVVSHSDGLDLSEKLKAIKPFASDAHFGVREMAWMAARPSISGNVVESLRILSLWALHPDENIRRFATEATRPRGVWCKHIDTLKKRPEIAEQLLEPLKDDSSAYVQNSVGNWLNDAGKTRPDWLGSTCKRWLQYSPSEHTIKIVKRATRNAIVENPPTELNLNN